MNKMEERHKEKESFRKWVLKTHGRQDANDYAGTFTEDMAIAYTKEVAIGFDWWKFEQKWTICEYSNQFKSLSYIKGNVIKTDSELFEMYLNTQVSST